MRTPSDRATRRSVNLPTVRGRQITLPPRLADDHERAAWEQAVHDDDRLIALDLFCGAGGLSLGFRDAGFFVAAGVDHDLRCVETHAANFSANSQQADLSCVLDDASALSLVRDQLGLDRVDVVIGGPPCQGFAAVGRAKIRSLSSERRKLIELRNDLYRQFVHVVRALQPVCFVMENVPHLETYAEGEVAEQIYRDFQQHYEIGFTETPGAPARLQAAEYGVPESRPRIFFVGFRRDSTARINGPVTSHRPPVPLARNRDPAQPPLLTLTATQVRAQFTTLGKAPPRTLADAIADLPAWLVRAAPVLARKLRSQSASARASARIDDRPGLNRFVPSRPTDVAKRDAKKRRPVCCTHDATSEQDAHNGKNRATTRRRLPRHLNVRGARAMAANHQPPTPCTPGAFLAGRDAPLQRLIPST